MLTESIQDINKPLWEILKRLAVETISLVIIIPLIYRRFARNSEHLFPFFLMGMMIFIVCVLLKNVEIQMGMVLGLFAIFSILRFRTYNFSTKDMSYLFAIIGLSAINAMLDFPNPVRGTILFNLIVILVIVGTELLFKNQVVTEIPAKEKKKKKKGEGKAGKEKRPVITIRYNKPELLAPGRREELIADLSKQSGKDISEVRIRALDLVEGSAELEAYFSEE